MLNNIAEIISNNILPNNIVKIIGYCKSEHGCKFIKYSKKGMIVCKNCGNLICKSCTNKYGDKCILCSDKNKLECNCNFFRKFYTMCWNCGEISNHCMKCDLGFNNHGKFGECRNYCNKKCKNDTKQELFSQKK